MGMVGMWVLSSSLYCLEMEDGLRLMMGGRRRIHLFAKRRQEREREREREVLLVRKTLYYK